MVVVVQTVQSVVVLVGTSAIHGPAAAVGIHLAIRLPAQKHHAPLEAEKVQHIVALKWQGLNLGLIERSTDGRIVGIERDRLSVHLNNAAGGL